MIEPTRPQIPMTEPVGVPARPLAPEDRWLQRIRMMVLEQHERPVWREARQIVELLQAANANAIRWPTIVWAITFFDSQYLPKHSGAAGRDLLQELLDAAGGTGIQVVPYCHVGVMHRETFVVHPEWAARGRDGVALRWKNLHYLHCLSNPESLAAYCGAVGEVVGRYAVPAIYFDGPVWYGLCYCQHCLAAFRRMWGYPMPEQLTWTDGSQAHYNEMRYRICVDAMRQLKSAIRAAQGARRVPAMFNTGMTHSSGRRNGSIPERVMEHAEGCLSTEVHRRSSEEAGEHGSYLGIVETVRLGVSLRRTALCYTPPGPFDSLVTHDSLDTDLFGATYLAFGGTPIIETARSFLFDRTGLPRVRALFERMERHAPLYYDAAPVRHGAVLYSRQTAEHYAPDDLAGRYAQHFAGALRALTHGHQAFVALYDRHLCAEELDGVRVLVLANAAALSDAQVEVIREFVRQGGGVVATAETSLYDEYGRRRPDFALADLFGVSYQRTCPPGDYSALQYREGDGYQPVPEAYLRWLDPAHPLATGLPPDQLIPISDAWWVGGSKANPDYVITAPRPASPPVADHPDPQPLSQSGPHPQPLSQGGRGEHAVIREATGEPVVAELYLPAGGAYGEPFRFPLGHPPGVVATTYGAGRVVYIASGVTRHYLRRGLRGLRFLLNNAVDWAASVPRPFRIDGPATLLAHLTAYPGDYSASGQETGASAGALPSRPSDGTAVETLALHLINYTGDMHENSTHRVEYVAPLRDLPVEFAIPDGRRVLSVERLIAGDPLSFAASDAVVRCSVDVPGPSETVLVRLGRT